MSETETGEPALAADGEPPRLPADKPRGRGFGRGSIWREVPVLVVVAIVLALLIKTFLAQAFFIPSGSMEQTLHIHDRVLVNKLVYDTRTPHRGEVVVFDTKGTGFTDDTETAPCPSTNAVVGAVRSVQRFLGVGSCGDTDYIKRVIAVPGDTIRCCTLQHQVILDGRPLAEPYLYEASPQVPFCAAPAGELKVDDYGVGACQKSPTAITVPKGMYWVMGDHRDDSSDSRPNGFVPADKIVGRAFVRIWPPSRIGFLHVPKTFGTVASGAVAGAATPVLAAPALLVPLLGWRVRRRRRGPAGRLRDALRRG